MSKLMDGLSKGKKKHIDEIKLLSVESWVRFEKYIRKTVLFSTIASILILIVYWMYEYLSGNLIPTRDGSQIVVQSGNVFLNWKIFWKIGLGVMLCDLGLIVYTQKKTKQKSSETFLMIIKWTLLLFFLNLSYAIAGLVADVLIIFSVFFQYYKSVKSK